MSPRHPQCSPPLTFLRVRACCMDTSIICPQKTTIECFSFNAHKVTPTSIHMAADVMERLHLKADQTLIYCSECKNVFQISDHNQALPIGTMDGLGGIFVPDEALRHTLTLS